MNTAANTFEKQSPVTATHREGYLFGPWIDFLGLGGASLICLAFLAMLFDPVEARADLFFIFLLLTNIINHPHFAHSYQIFYRDFGRKIGSDTESLLRYRYWFAGIIAPIGLAVFFILALFNNNAHLIGYGVNIMVFLVGWHYVKQGYGMLSVDSVLKRKFFTDGEKKLLIWNAYAGWLYSWAFINNLVNEKSFQGFEYYTIGTPPWVETALLLIAAAFGFLTFLMFAKRMLSNGKGLPFNGVMAYVTSIYVWLIVAQFNPLFLVVIPAFHSLQYLTVVARFQLNVETEAAENGATTWLTRYIKSAAMARLIRFYMIGLALGVLGFWALPIGLSELLNLEIQSAHALIILIVIWLFINIHHYLLDNVMWRKGNPDVSKHLFAHH